MGSQHNARANGVTGALKTSEGERRNYQNGVSCPLALAQYSNSPDLAQRQRANDSALRDSNWTDYH